MTWHVDHLPTPCYVVDRQLLNQNLAVLDRVQQAAGCKILLALKGFAMWSLFPQIRQTLAGASASSLNEARLAAEEFGGETHVYAPAYRDEEFQAILRYADHLVFNSFSQWRRFRDAVQGAGRAISSGLRVNPGYAEVEVELYNPCAPGSRLGIPASQFEPESLDGIEGLHFHALCEQGADVLARVLAHVEARFGRHIHGLRWVNFGGGHHLTRPGYDVDLLVREIVRFREKYGVRVYLEPGEAIALNTGVLVASVLDIVHNEMDIAILDTSATAHMPDVLEMPYRPEVQGAGQAGQFTHTYRLAGLTCLAGDVIGDYSFPAPLAIGQKLVFLDMAHYTMVKNTAFNGVPLPAIAIIDSASNAFTLVRQFGYEDYRNRLS
ncbi:MAG: carboxynorspermidine decarboxylase [Desulfobacterales bacterium CG2_30_60_27]|nr:MAG: carboxynorspermidine decarboxylase [Desulfobacterales bacterium CG2_30_60_27]